MYVGYARVSTDEQHAGFNAQVTELQAAGCERVFKEHVSAVAASRPELERALDFVREGDTLVVCKLDRLARSITHLWQIVGALDAKGVGLVIRNLGGSQMDTTSASGRLTLSLFGAVAEFERSLMLERQRAGIAKAQAEGKYRGRKPTARAKADEVRRLKGEGVSPTEIAGRLGIGRASVYRVLQEGPA
ncbi:MULTISPECIES: recombinase family protein [unclassified Xanthobacter]|uniref:recombinase family protein n=1 Tax=unclassified Xanthobacter TaxID=2623496 RepID=UPI001EDDA8CB|nr:MULTISPECIES: recombinase family protein [unclassified Xanthobacter]